VGQLEVADFDPAVFRLRNVYEFTSLDFPVVDLHEYLARLDRTLFAVFGLVAGPVDAGLKYLVDCAERVEEG